MRVIIQFLFISTYLISQNTNDPFPLSEHLKPFSSYVGKTFKGKFTHSTQEKPAYDVSRWERALNGNAIRILHSVNNGEYGGESIIMWDSERESLASWYFTTAGFYTMSTFEFDGKRLIGLEDVSGNQNGITKVKTIIQLLPDGKLQNRSKYFMNNVWVDGHEIYYQEAPDAKVIFK